MHAFRPIRAAALTMLLASSVSCFEEDVTAVEFQIVGSYELTSVNGAPLPILVGEDESGLIRVASGQIVLRLDGRTCDYSHTFEIYSVELQTTRVETDAAACTWQVTGGSIILHFPPSGFVPGVFFRDALWFDFEYEEPMQFVYERAR